MTLPQDEIVKGFEAELADFEGLIRSLGPDEWQQPSRCEGWTVADVAAHVTGGLADILAGNFDGVGTPGYTDRQVEQRRGRSPEEIADELHGVAKQGIDLASSFDAAAWEGPAPTDFVPTLGFGVEGLWYDAYLHGDDIRTAVGRESARGPGLRASVSHVAALLGDRGWGPATLALDGMEEFPVAGGGDRRITADPLAFVLAATGRAAPEPLGLDASVNIYS